MEIGSSCWFPGKTSSLLLFIKMLVFRRNFHFEHAIKSFWFADEKFHSTLEWFKELKSFVKKLSLIFKAQSFNFTFETKVTSSPKSSHCSNSS
jgi:hypothetical protein